MTKENIELLSRPVLHATIWGVAPREVMGDYKFKKIKKTSSVRGRSSLYDL